MEDDYDDFIPILAKFMRKFADPKSIDKVTATIYTFALSNILSTFRCHESIKA